MEINGPRPYTLFDGKPIPAITADEMRIIDDALIGIGYDLLQLMENAGAALTYLTAHYLEENVDGKTVIVLAGHGHNGGGGLVAARRLYAYGACVRVLTLKGEHKPTTLHQLKIVKNMGIPVHVVSELDNTHLKDIASADILIDALVGYGLRESLTGITAKVVEGINGAVPPVISLDIPSGLASGGEDPQPLCVQASATLTLALPKIGLLRPHAQYCTGKLFLADIGVPSALYQTICLEVPPIFRGNPYIALST